MSLQTRLLADAAPQPWRNGGGVTRELLAWPAAHDWQLRLSVAEIEADGPFSSFPGIERWFVVLRGAGVRLVFDRGTETLDRASPPLCFDGADAPGCTLIDGPTQDLNLMLRRDAGRGQLRAARVGERWLGPGRLRGLFCGGAARLQVDGAAVELRAAGLVFDDAAAFQDWQLLAAQAGAWWFSFDSGASR